MKFVNIAVLATCLFPFVAHAQDVADITTGTVRRNEVEVEVNDKQVVITAADPMLDARADNSNPMVAALMASIGTHSIGLPIIDLSNVPFELVCGLSVYPGEIPFTTVIAFFGAPIIILTFPIGDPVQTIQGLIDLGILILPDGATASCVGGTTIFSFHFFCVYYYV